MQKGWIQTWKNLLFQHFEIEDITVLNKHLPKDCEFDDFEGKHYLGLVNMNMTDVRHKSTGSFVWFKNYNELNVRTYIKHKGARGVLFLSLDVDSFISFVGARLFYGLPYRLRKFTSKPNHPLVYSGSKVHFECEYKIASEPKKFTKETFAYWATERYFFAQKYLWFSFMGAIEHKQWNLREAVANNINLEVLAPYNTVSRHTDVIYCDSIDIKTNSLRRI